MSTSQIYHSFGIRGYQHVSSRWVGGCELMRIEQAPKKLRCPCCGTADVTARGTMPRVFRTLPIASQACSKNGIEIPKHTEHISQCLFYSVSSGNGEEMPVIVVRSLRTEKHRPCETPEGVSLAGRIPSIMDVSAEVTHAQSELSKTDCSNLLPDLRLYVSDLRTKYA